MSDSKTPDEYSFNTRKVSEKREKQSAAKVIDRVMWKDAAFKMNLKAIVKSGKFTNLNTRNYLLCPCTWNNFNRRHLHSCRKKIETLTSKQSSKEGKGLDLKAQRFSLSTTKGVWK